MRSLQTYGGMRSKRADGPVLTNIRVLRRLFDVIADRELTLDSVAKANNMTRQTLAAWKAGRNSPKLCDFEAMAESLGYDVMLVRRK